MADENQESVAEVFEHHVPEHPLPEEIKKMARDDTVCKFCGVSYLIHNEIKAMEEKLKATLAEMEHFRGAVDREKKLIEKLAEKEREMEQLRQDLTGKDDAMTGLKNELRVKDDACGRLQQTRANLQEKLGVAIQEAETYKLKHGFLMEGVRSFKTDLGHQKAFLREVRSKVNQQGDQMKTECGRLGALVTRYSAKESNVVQGLQSKVAQLEKEKQAVLTQISSLQDKLGSTVAELATAKVSVDGESKLKAEVQQLRDSVHELEAENISVSSRLRTTEMELEQFREQIRNKTSEIEKINRQFQTQEKTSQASISRLRKDLDQKEVEVSKTRQELKKLKQQYEDSERAAADLKQKTSASTWHTAEVEEQLERVRSDCEALKAERELIISAHQSQIEQLRESFKTRLTDADRWPQKLEEALRKEKKRHVSELEGLESKLKENFVMELEIEKQKHQELLQKYLSEYKDSDKKFKSELSVVQSRHKAEIAEVHRQMAEAKARGREAEGILRKEIESLKNIIRDLEARLAKVDNSGETVSAEWRVKTGLIQQELEEVKGDKRKLEMELNKIKEEATFLQETVRRECEERFELTEALSEAREELLRLKRPPGGFSNSSTPRQGNSPLTSAASSSAERGHDRSRAGSRVTGQRSEEMMLFRKRVKSGAPHPPPKPSRDVDPVDTNNVNLGFEGDPARSAGKVKGGTLGDSRRRIAEAVGRT